MIVLGLDLGRNVGASLGEPGAHPTLETWKLPQTTGAMLSEFEGRLRGVIRRNNALRLIAYEKPFAPFGKASANTTKHLYTAFGQAGTILKLCYEHSIVPQSFHVRSVRKRFCGSAKASPEDILKSCFRAGFAPSDDHNADACLIWRCAIADMIVATYGGGKCVA